MVFTSRLLLEKAREQQTEMYFAFLDLTKAFDTVNRELLWLIKERFGCPPRFLSLMKAFHTETRACVISGGDKSADLAVNAGVKQG
jgi:hypothetical protein